MIFNILEEDAVLMKTGVVSHALLFIFFCYLQLYLRNYLYRGLIAVLYHNIHFLVLKIPLLPPPYPISI